MSLLYLACKVAPAMIKNGSGCKIVTGNSSALRGKTAFAAFALTNAYQRILAEPITRDLGPKGIQIAYVIIHVGIDLRWTRRLNPELAY